VEIRAPGERGRKAQLSVPVYVYRRHDGSSFEFEQRITADALVSCPTTGQSVERVMQPFSPRYKGTGFYSTDHREALHGAGEPIQAAPAERAPVAVSRETGSDDATSSRSVRSRDAAGRQRRARPGDEKRWRSS
jgi:predicted nucleic acid-binding Zn ribbon protein